jgi:predicted ester cyclase
MSAEQNKEVIRRLFDEFYNGGNMDVVDELFHANSIVHDPNTGDRLGAEVHKERHQAQLAVTPDFHMTLDDMVADGDKVAYRWTCRGTDNGVGFMGRPPTGISVAFSGMTVARFVDGKIIEAWHNYDMIRLLQQLGVIPTPQ